MGGTLFDMGSSTINYGAYCTYDVKYDTGFKNNFLPLPPPPPPTHTASPSGKLTMTEHRSSVLSAIETLSHCPLSSSGMTDLGTVVAEGLVAHVKQEGGRGSICVLIKQTLVELDRS